MPSPLAPLRTWLFVPQIVLWSIFTMVLGDVCGACISPPKLRYKKLARSKLPRLSRSERR